MGWEKSSLRDREIKKRLEQTAGHGVEKRRGRVQTALGTCLREQLIAGGEDCHQLGERGRGGRKNCAPRTVYYGTAAGGDQCLEKHR